MLFDLPGSPRCAVHQSVLQSTPWNVFCAVPACGLLKGIIQNGTRKPGTGRVFESFQRRRYVGLEQQSLLICTNSAEAAKEFRADFSPAILLQGWEDCVPDFIRAESVIVRAFRDPLPAFPHGQTAMWTVTHCPTPMSEGYVFYTDNVKCHVLLLKNLTLCPGKLTLL